MPPILTKLLLDRTESIYDTVFYISDWSYRFLKKVCYSVVFQEMKWTLLDRKSNEGCVGGCFWVRSILWWSFLPFWTCSKVSVSMGKNWTMTISMTMFQQTVTEYKYLDKPKSAIFNTASLLEVESRIFCFTESSCQKHVNRTGFSTSHWCLNYLPPVSSPDEWYGESATLPNLLLQ